MYKSICLWYNIIKGWERKQPESNILSVKENENDEL